MAIMKFQIGEGTPEQQRKRVSSSGGYGSSNQQRKYANSQTARTPVTKAAQFAGSGANVVFTQPMFFSPLHTPQNWQTPSKRRESYQWCRFYYDNEPKVAAGIDFYSSFPLNGFKLECKDRKILEFYENQVEDLDLSEWLNYISFDYHLLGEVYPFLEIDCPHCAGKGIGKDGQQCNHPDGLFKSIRVMNPDYIEVQSNVLADEKLIAMRPDEELQMIVQRRQPKQIFDKLDPRLVELVASQQPIPLSNRSVSHIKHNSSGYSTYGNSPLRRLFTILAYKTKIMTANWIVAERMILPVRVVKVGDKDRPANEEDIQDVVNQLAAVTNDPNLTIVTHHAFSYDWFGASGKIHNISNEIELIGKEILDGLMLNQALLNGEMSSYGSAQVGVEILLHRLENWRNRLKNWVEKKIFLPIAMMQGFIDEEKTARTGRTTYLYPKLKWNDLNLKDKTQKVQLLLQMYDKQLVSAQSILEELGLDYDSEVEKIREEQVMASAGGMLQPGGPGGPMGGGGGPLGAMPTGGGPVGGDMGGMPGGDMGGMGGMPGGAPMGGAPAGGPMGAAAGGIPKVTKKGKKGKQEEQAPAPPKLIKMTKLEAKMYKGLQSLNIPYNLFGQYEVRMPGHKQAFVLDFAYPQLGVCVESDGQIWHQREDFKVRDNNRDEELANVGWRILRFTEDAVENHMDMVLDVIKKNIAEASKERKRASESNTLEKYAKIKEDILDSNISENFLYNIKDMENGLGYFINIGN